MKFTLASLGADVHLNESDRIQRALRLTRLSGIFGQRNGGGVELKN